jgi:AAA family ATP:ADP antiporter
MRSGGTSVALRAGVSRPSWLDRALRPFSKVHPGEGRIAILMFACVFAILTSYYLMKTAREGLILSGGTFGLRGDELKTYATGAMALLLVGIVPAYGVLANRVRRIRLINTSYAIVIASLVGFYVLGRSGAPIGLAFFVWLGLVSVFLIAQFWSYANDIYTEEQGKRLFAIIAIGGSLGAVVGPRLTKLATTHTLLVFAAAILVVCLLLFNAVERAHGHREQTAIAPAPIGGPGGFALVLRDRYLLLIAALLMVVNLVNTTGEYVLSSAVRDYATGVTSDVAERRELIKAFYGNFFFWVNLVGLLVQAFAVSRVIDKIGVRGALFVMPIIAFGAYGLIGIAGGIALVRAGKIAENATDYSLQNTVRQALFLPTSRAVKYKAKAAIDTFFVRLGDTASAILVGLGIHQLGLVGRDLALVNVALVVVWFAIAAGVAHRHRMLSPPAAKPEAPPALQPAGAAA